MPLILPSRAAIRSSTRSLRVALRGVTLAAAVAACGGAPSLPGPSTPLVPTPDEPFRSKRPAVAAADPAGVGSMPEVREAVLENGFTVWVVPRSTLPYVALSLVARDAGTLNGTASAELLALTSRAMVEGGMIWTHGELVDPPTVHGRGVSFAVLPSHTELELHVLRPALAGGVDVLARTVRAPSWAGGALDPMRLAELRWQQQVSLGSVLLKLTVEGAYGSAIASRFAPLETHLLKTLALDDVRRCHQQHFRPEQSALIAVGDTTLTEVQELAARSFGSRPKSAEPVRAPAPTRRSSGRQVHFLPTGELHQASLLLLQPAPTSERPDDELPFALLAEVAVGAFRSRANTELRHHAGLTYGLHPRFIRSQRLGLMAVEAAVEASEAIDAILQLLHTFEALMKAPVSSEELARAKLSYAAGLERSAGDNRELAELLARAFSAGRGAAWLAGVPEALTAVTATDVQRVAGEYLTPHDVEIGVAGRRGLARPLAFVGPVTWAQAKAKP
jgi:zinc protease